MAIVDHCMGIFQVHTLGRFAHSYNGVGRKSSASLHIPFTFPTPRCVHKYTGVEGRCCGHLDAVRTEERTDSLAVGEGASSGFVMGMEAAWCPVQSPATRDELRRIFSVARFSPDSIQPLFSRA